MSFDSLPTTARASASAFWPARLPRELVLPATSLWFNLEVSARRYPDKAAYVFFGRTLSYSQLLQQAEALSSSWTR